MKHILKKFSTIHRQSCLYLDRRLKQLGIRSGQFMYIMLACEKDGLSQENISAELKIDKSAVARTIKQLEVEGYVLRKVSNEDKRQYCIYATEKAKNIYKDMTDTVEAGDDYLMEGLTDIEKELLNSLLDKIINNNKY
jgi:DNA-binding MarR family transcriptional regulator